MDPPPFNGDSNLTLEDFDILYANVDTESDFKPRRKGIGYPSGPFFQHFADCFLNWAKTG